MKDSLVDYVFECSDLGFISDLKYCNDARIYEIVNKILPEDFSLEAWNGFYNYLFGKDIDEDSQAAAKACLLEAMATTIKGA